MDHTVAPPLNVHFAPPSPGETLQALLGAQVPKDRPHTGQAPPIHRSGCRRVNFRHHLLGEGRFGVPAQAGQLVAAGLGGVSTRLSERPALAIRLLSLIAAVEVVLDLVPSGFELEPLPPRAPGAIPLWVVEEIGPRNLFVR
jgi:hypothetical protein